MAKFVGFQGVKFNIGWVASKSLAEVIEHEKHHGIPDERMKELHDFCREYCKMPKEQAKAFAKGKAAAAKKEKENPTEKQAAGSDPAEADKKPD